jgi:carbon-monoxide dehydrogenase medium subunit
MRPHSFRYTRASTIDEALSAAADDGTFLAGGQSMLPQLKLRDRTPEHLVDLNGVTELQGISDGSGAVRIGAMTRHRAVLESPVVAQSFPSLTEAATHLGDVQVRNRGTIGGNVCWADPRANLSGVLISLGADALVRSASGGARTVPVEDLFSGFQRTGLGAGELLTGFELPLSEPGTHSSYRELSVQPNGLPIVNVAVCITGDPISSARIAVGGLATVPIRATRCEEALHGETLTSDLAVHVAGLLDTGAAQLLNNFQAAAPYRTTVAKVLLKRALLESARKLRSGNA